MEHDQKVAVIMSLNKKWIWAAAVTVLAAAFFLWREWRSGSDEPPPQPSSGIRLSAWIADWQWKPGVLDLEQLGGSVKELSMFAAYFNHRDELHFTEQYGEALPEVREAAAAAGVERMLLTIVNDRFGEDGTAIQKDPDLVSRLVATDTAREAHINQIVETAKESGFGGVEIDYEKVHKRDLGKLTLFYGELYERLQAEGLSLRIVIEPGMKTEGLDFPEGPSYVMMAYNLYGGHSGPGPKADHRMIRNLADKLRRFPGNTSLALSVGGFDWPDGGKVVSLTEKRAAELAASSSAAPQRDADSGALHFEYTDDAGVRHTVWYADGTTLAGWMATAMSAGISDIAIWRLGELEPDTLKRLREEAGS